MAAAALVVVGLAATVLPALPGIPLIFGGLWLIARVDEYRHVGPGWLIGIAFVGAAALTLDFIAVGLGAKRVGASPRAVWGAMAGMAIGLLFGLPGVILGPFFGALLGELAAGNSVLRSAHVGASAWLGLLLGTVLKLVSGVTMISLFGLCWWWHRVS